jgi:ornithine cyclodeaminase
MQFFSDDDVRNTLAWDDVLAALEAGFRHKDRFIIPERTMIQAKDNVYLTMPCLDADGWFGVKQVAIVPANNARNLPTVQAHYTLNDPQGTPSVSASATLMTKMRTAGASALAARYLAPADAKTLLVVGTGSLAPWQAEAHAQVRPYERVLVWGRKREKTASTRADIAARLPNVTVTVTDDLAAACQQADVITVATTAKHPIIMGDWLADKPLHLDLVGAFTPEMAEADPLTINKAAVYIDDLAGIRAEAGDLIQASEAGWSFDEVQADLQTLVRDFQPANKPLTLFKSVGLALEDLQVAKLLSR